MGKVKMTMVCEEEQLRLIMKALEEYERLRIGQAWILAESIALDGFKHDWADDDGRKEYIRRYGLRDHLQKMIEEVIKYGLKQADKECCAKTEEVRSIEDLWIGLRHRCFYDLLTPEEQEERGYTVDSREPFGDGEYPLASIKIERVEK